MGKKIKANLYMESKIQWKPLRAVSDPRGFLFSEGIYRTKILPADLPEWFIFGYIYRGHGYISSKGVNHLLFVPNYTFSNHLHKYDSLFISYKEKIEPYKTDLTTWYKGYDHVIGGSLIKEFVEAVERYSGYDAADILREIGNKRAWYQEHNTQ